MSVAIRMTRWLMPSIVAVSLSGVLSAMLNAYHRFRSAALVGVAVNAVTIALRRLLEPRHRLYALVLGTTLGLTAQMLVQLPSFLSIGKYRPIIDLKHPGLKRFGFCSGRSSSARPPASSHSFSIGFSHQRWLQDTSRA